MEIESTPLEITRTILDTTSTDEDKKALVVAVGVIIFMLYFKDGRPCLTIFLNTEKRVENTTRSGEGIFGELRGVWKCGQVFDISSQTKLKMEKTEK